MTKISLPPAYASLPCWAFGDSKEMADELCALVLAGKKTATSGALYQYETEGLPVPEPGIRNVILDGDGKPRCVIECTDVDIKRFDEVDADFARAEGEGDCSHKYWRKAREAYFRRQGYFSPDMLLVCEHFRVLELLEFKRVVS